MSAPEATSTCSTCGSALPGAVRFCPECGTRVGDEPQTRLQEAPLDQGTPRVFGAAPQGALLALAAAAVVGAIVLFVVGSPLGGALLLVVAAVFLAAWAAGAGRSGTRGTTRLHAVRDRGRVTFERLSTQAQLRREHLRLRGEVERLGREREQALRALGAAVYGEDEAGTTEARAAVRELDDRIRAKEDEMSQIAARAEQRLADVRLDRGSTVLLEPPMPEPVPEPYPPPDEGTPPMPEPVPEPYPPPDEGEPPRPA